MIILHNPHLLFLHFCNIGPKCCIWKKGVRRKRNTQTRNLRKKNSHFYSLGLRWVAARKVRFIAFFLPLLLGGNGRCHGSRLVDTFLSVVSWHDGLGSPELLTHLFRTLPWTPKISWLDFLYRDILEQFEGSRMFSDTSENYRETPDNSCVIILKSRLNSVGHSACMH